MCIRDSFFGVYDDLRVSEYLEFYGEAAGCLIGEVRKSIPALLELSLIHI